MAQIAPAARQSFSLTAVFREAWQRLVRSQHTETSDLFGADVAFSDSLERELNDHELHRRAY